MKRLLALLPLLLLLNGCASDPDDREFYERGWLHPKVDHEEREFYRSFFWDD